jgi:hypothetical protein
MVRVGRVGLACVSAALLLFGTVAVAAADVYCDTDPPVVIVTPAGNRAAVYVSNGGSAEHVASLLAPSISYTVKPVESGRATSVHLTVTVPDDALGSGYAVRSEAWSGPLRTGTRYDSETGFSGQPITLQFKLDVP